MIQVIKTHAHITPHLLRDVPGHVDVALVLVHPNLRHPESVAAHVGGQVLGVGLVGTLNVRNPGTR